MKNALNNAFSEILKNLDFPNIDVQIQLPKNSKHGDFSTNLAMQLAGKLGKNPKDIATILAQKLLSDFPHLVNSTEIAGPGFINISINKSSITDQLKSVIEQDDMFGHNELFNGKKAQVEFVSANPTGPLTVGHGRGAILGDVIANILKWNGYTVDREYYYNNAGKQMQRLGDSVRARYMEILGEKSIFPEGGYEGDYIKDIAKELYQVNGTSLKNIQEIKPFKDCAEKNIFQHIKSTLTNIDLHFDQFFNENSLYKSGAINNIIDLLKKKNLIYEQDSAIWIKTSTLGRDQDRVIVKSSGEPTYRLPDIAYHYDKFNRQYDLLVDVLGADHIDAYPDVLAAIKELGCNTKKIKIIIHQFVTLTENGEPIKMSTRKANYITLDDLIEEVGKDVVRYFFIMRGMNTHLNFDMKLAKNESDENPVYYLQYAHARLCNILKHAESQGFELDKNTDLSHLKLDIEFNLIKSLLEFPNIIKNTLNNLEPQTIANYLQNLASTFHKYYANERIVTEDVNRTNAKLILIKALKIVLYNGLKILGINAPERM